MGFPEQPEWLKETVRGMAEAPLYEVSVEGSSFAIIKCRGYKAWIDRMSGLRYAPVRYVLVQKGKNYWHGPWKYVHYGRLRKGDFERLQAIAKAADGGMDPKEWETRFPAPEHARRR